MGVSQKFSSILWLDTSFGLQLKTTLGRFQVEAQRAYSCKQIFGLCHSIKDNMSANTFGWLSHRVQHTVISKHNPLTVHTHMVPLYHASNIKHHMSIICHHPHLLSIIYHQYCLSHSCKPPINHDTMMTITKHQLLGK